MDRTILATLSLTCTHHPMGWAAATPRKDSQMEQHSFTESERLDIGREIYDGLLTIPEAAAKYGTTYGVARTCLRKYRKPPAQTRRIARFRQAARKPEHGRAVVDGQGAIDRRGHKGQGGG